MDDDHPFVLELASLRQTADRFQNEANAAAIKLQRYSLESSHLHAHTAALEQENTRLAHELEILRAHPDVLPNPAVLQVQELSLALQRVSEKIALTEDTLLARTTELADSRSELARERHAADAAYELAARMRAREEASKAHARELEFKARASEEERKMTDLVVQEYADLVRNLEGRKSSNPSVPAASLVDALHDSKSTLHEMLTTFSTESDQLQATIAELTAQVSDLQMALGAERSTASHDRTLLSQAKTQLDRLNLEDQTAAKMVAHYMKFSQASTNALQEQITTLRTRHAATIATLQLQLSATESQLASERVHTARLQDALDELCQDLARESYGRRREVALRLALLSREEAVAEFMQRWARRATESYARCYDSAEPNDPVQEAFHRVVTDADSLLSTLDDDIRMSDATRTSGSLARIMLSREAVDALRNELQDEMQKRVEFVRNFLIQNGTDNPGDDHLLRTPNSNARLAHKAPPIELPPSEDTYSPVSAISALVNDPFLVSAPVTPSTAVTIEEAIMSPSEQDSASTSATLTVDEDSKIIESSSPVVSTLDIQQDLKPSSEKGPLVTDTKDTAASPPPEADLDAPVLAKESTSPTTTAPPTLISELENTEHRYDALQRSFRDCSLALKDLKRTLASFSSLPASPAQTQTQATTVRQRLLEMALVRIDDYTEDARVELEIQITDEALTVRGYVTVLSIPGALSGTEEAEERAELEAGARAFVDGTDEGVGRALERFRKKLEDVEHDVAVVKRAVHELGVLDEKGEGGREEGEWGEGTEEVDDESRDKGRRSSWTTWTAGLLGATGATIPTGARSPTPAQTFGAVMTTSPRLRSAASLQQLRAEREPGHEHSDQGPLARLNLRIPMPFSVVSPTATEHVHGPYGPVGLGHVIEGRTGVGSGMRTVSGIYAVSGWRSASSVGLGVGLGGSASSASASARRSLGGGTAAGGMGTLGASSPLRGEAMGRGEDVEGDGEAVESDARHDFGGVE